MIVKIATLPDKWCLSAEDFSGDYDANKIYLGRRKNLERGTSIELKWVFNDLSEQREFFTWWKNETDSGALPFYANLPLFAEDKIIPKPKPPKDDRKYYLIIQTDPITQTIEPDYTISGQFMLFGNKTEDHMAPPIASDITAFVEESSTNNVILLRVVDADSDRAPSIEMVGNHDGITLKGQSVLYAPPLGFIGTKTFHYKANDGTHDSNTAELKIIVGAYNSPWAIDMHKFVAIGDPGTYRYFKLDWLDNGSHAGVPEIVNNGGASVDATMYNNPDFPGYVKIKTPTGPESFTFRVNNGKFSNVATVNVNKRSEVPEDFSKHVPSKLVLPMAIVPSINSAGTLIYDYVVYRMDSIYISPKNGKLYQPSIDISLNTPSSVKEVILTNTPEPNKKAIVFRMTGVMPATDEDFDVPIRFIGGTLGAFTIVNIPTKMVSNKNNITYNSATNITVHMRDGDFYQIGAFANEPKEYPSRTSFPDVLSGWLGEKSLSITGRGYLNEFSKYRQLGPAIPEHIADIAINEYGLIEIRKINFGNCGATFKVDNPNGDTTTFDLHVIGI